MTIRNGKRIAVIASMLLLALSFVLIFAFNKSAFQDTSSAKNAVEQDVDSSQSGGDQRQINQTVLPAGAINESSITLSGAKIDEYLCESKECESDPLSARTKEEAMWLIRNGYPSTKDLKAWDLLSDDQLKRVADSGSLAARAVYGERIALKGDMSGLSELLTAANSGSIYSYYGTSKIYADRNVIDGAAFLRVAYMLGDSRASGVMMDRFPRLGPADYYLADKRAAELYKSYAHARAPVPRP